MKGRVQTTSRHPTPTSEHGTTHENPTRERRSRTPALRSRASVSTVAKGRLPQARLHLDTQSFNERVLAASSGPDSAGPCLCISSHEGDTPLAGPLVLSASPSSPTACHLSRGHSFSSAISVRFKILLIWAET